MTGQETSYLESPQITFLTRHCGDETDCEIGGVHSTTEGVYKWIIYFRLKMRVKRSLGKPKNIREDNNKIDLEL